MRFLSTALLTLFATEALADDGKGAKVYQTACQVCHGAYGGKPVLPNARNLKTADYKNPKGATVEGVLDVLQNGLPGTAMTSQAHVPLSDRQAVAAFVIAGRAVAKAPDAGPAADTTSAAKAEPVEGVVRAAEPVVAAPATPAPTAMKKLTLEQAIEAELAEAGGPAIGALNPFGLPAGMPPTPEPVAATDADPAADSEAAAK
jgi:mono/diheme cytochrome c family protein